MKRTIEDTIHSDEHRLFFNEGQKVYLFRITGFWPAKGTCAYDNRAVLYIADAQLSHLSRAKLKFDDETYAFVRLSDETWTICLERLTGVKAANAKLKYQE